MGQLRIKANEYKCQEYHRKLKDQFIDGTNDKVMTSEIIKELAAIKDTS